MTQFGFVLHKDTKVALKKVNTAAELQNYAILNAIGAMI